MLVAVPRLFLARNAIRILKLAILTADYCDSAARACQLGASNRLPLLEAAILTLVSNAAIASRWAAKKPRKRADGGADGAGFP